jgi:FkbM family methyltransferase
MTQSRAIAPVRTLHQAYLWRLLQAMLPLGQRFNLLLLLLLRTDGYFAVPWGRHWLTIPAAWLDVASSASAPIYQTPRRQNPEFFALLAPQIDASRGGCIVDVGANIGVYTLNIRARTAAPLLAFEPEPSSFRLQCHNVAANGLAGVTIKNCACGDWTGEVGFQGGINGAVAGRAGEPNGTFPVPVVRLDDELRDFSAVDLIKIDCEGFEWHVLNGCGETIAAKRPVLFVELHPKLIGNYDRTLAQVCDLLRPHYSLAFWDINPAQRSRSRLRRFLSRYRQRLVPLASEAAALALAAREPRPDQLFLLALPHDRAP